MATQLGHRNGRVLKKRTHKLAVSRQTIRRVIIWGCVCLLLIILQMGRIQTATANPIWPYPDTFEIIPSPNLERDCIYCGQCLAHCPVGAFKAVGEFDEIEKQISNRPCQLPSRSRKKTLVLTPR
jgi:ferredoxin